MCEHSHVKIKLIPGPRGCRGRSGVDGAQGPPGPSGGGVTIVDNVFDIVAPTPGMLVFETSNTIMAYYTGTKWIYIVGVDVPVPVPEPPPVSPISFHRECCNFRGSRRNYFNRN